MKMRTVLMHIALFTTASMALLVGGAFKVGFIAPLW